MRVDRTWPSVWTWCGYLAAERLDYSWGWLGEELVTFRRSLACSRVWLSTGALARLS